MTKVLIADFDLFHTVGGGQTYYRSLIGRNPDIDYYYYRISEPANAQRPGNAHALPHVEAVRPAVINRLSDTQLRARLREYVNAVNVAASAADHQFDVVEVPDYHQFGGLLAPALRDYHMPVERIVVSLHGRMSRAIELNQDWRFEGSEVNLQEMTALELGQYAAADIRYGISRSYLREWQLRNSQPAHYLSPLHFLARPTLGRAVPSANRPDLCFVGRFEKWKGPDLFINLVWWLARNSYDTARLIGAQDSPAGQAWTARLKAQALNRLLPIHIAPTATRDELQALFASHIVTVLPSRWDTLNLVAIESTLSGCPTAISQAAGACEFLQENFPEVPFARLDVQDLEACQATLAHMLRDYTGQRERLYRALERAWPAPGGPDILQIYQAPAQPDFDARLQLERQYADCRTLYSDESRKPYNQARAAMRSAVPQPIRQQWHLLRTAAAGSTANNPAGGRVTSHLAKARRRVQRVARAAITARLVGGQSADQQIHANYQRARVGVGRATVWGQLAELERQRGRDIVACAYWLRMFRSQDEAPPEKLAQVTELLAANGFAAEANTAEAMFAPGAASQRLDRCLALLEQAGLAHQDYAADEFEFVDDRRGGSNFRVAVIVSLYSAAGKLSKFLQALRLQSLAKSGTLEVVLVDSGSPGDEYGVFQELVGDLPVVYARSARRETIQAAWNRGIRLARAPYLAFLGVDEGVLPVCLELLAAELDKDASIDWVQANSLVTSVDAGGAFLSDVMAYDRTGYEQDLVYLETCYLSWVGALYRRSIHDRFGYYDGTFRAAGDTEFKNRVLPFIKTKHVPLTLGVFWNYPEERTTAHPRAEIEDLRAWYLHRSPAGIQYAFRQQADEAIEHSLMRALNYRKSFAKHVSTDVEYATHVGAYLEERRPTARAVRLLPGARALLRAYRSLDSETAWTTPSMLSALVRVRARAARVQREHHNAIPDFRPVYRINNDNRYEQHVMLWGLDGELDAA